MRLGMGMASWFQLCTFLALGFMAWLSVYRPSSSRLQKEPVWLVEDSNASFKEILEILQEPAPTIQSLLTVEEAMKVVSSYCPTRVDTRSMEEENISTTETFDWPRSHFNQSLQNWLESNLSRLNLTFAIHHGEIVVLSRISDDSRSLRSYPCPAVDSNLLQEALESSGDNWVTFGGSDTIHFIDTDSQTLIVVNACYRTHRKLEYILCELNKCAGIGWRTDGPTWTRLPRAILGRLTDWIEPESQAPNPTLTPASTPLGGGGCCIF